MSHWCPQNLNTEDTKAWNKSIPSWKRIGAFIYALCGATFSLSWLGVLDLHFAVGASSKPRSVWLMTALWFLPKFPKATVLCHTPVLWHIPQAGKQREIPHKWRPYYVFFLLTRVVENRMLSESGLHAVYRSRDACMLFKVSFQGFLVKGPLTTWPGECDVDEDKWLFTAISQSKIDCMHDTKSLWIHWFGVRRQ